MQIKTKMQKNRQRYYLHYIVKKQGYTIVVRKKTIYVKNEVQKFTKQALKLSKNFGYNIQYTIS